MRQNSSGSFMRRYFTLHILALSTFVLGRLSKKAPKFQKIVYAESGSTSGDASEKHPFQSSNPSTLVRKDFSSPAWSSVEDSILTPVESPCTKFVPMPTSAMKGQWVMRKRPCVVPTQPAFDDFRQGKVEVGVQIAERWIHRALRHHKVLPSEEVNRAASRVALERLTSGRSECAKDRVASSCLLLERSALRPSGRNGLT